jgi:hypothetical protein
MNLFEAAREMASRLERIFLCDEPACASLRRNGEIPNRSLSDYVLFFENLQR